MYRPAMSTGEPAPYGQMILIVRVGYADFAYADPVQAGSAKAGIDPSTRSTLRRSARVAGRSEWCRPLVEQRMSLPPVFASVGVTGGVCSTLPKAGRCKIYPINSH